MTAQLLLQISTGALAALFLLNCFVAYKSIYAIAIMQQPNYRHKILLGAEQIEHDLRNQSSQRNFCFLNIAIMVAIILPLLMALLQLSNIK